MLKQIALACCALLAGCATGQIEKSAPYGPDSAKIILGANNVLLTPKDGTVKRPLTRARDFGVAWCSEMNGCIRKDDVAAVTWYEAEHDIGDNLAFGATMVAASPIAVGLCLLGACAAPIAAAFASLDGDGSIRPTKEMRSRLWLDELVEENGRVKRNTTNYCLVSRTFAAQPFATDAEALDFVWRNRQAIHGMCLVDAAEAIRAWGGPANMEIAKSLYALGAVRRVWDDARCDTGWTSNHPIRIPEWLDLGPRLGDPKMLDLIAAAVADPATYDQAPPDRIDQCKYTKPLPPEQWTERQQMMMTTLGPYGVYKRAAPAQAAK